jgi:predicted phosphodiesterase
VNDAVMHEVDTLMQDADAKVGKQQIKKMAEELIRRGVDPTELGRLSRMKMYQAVTKDDEGNAHVHDLWGFHLDPSWELGPSWPVIQPATQVKLPKRNAVPAVNNGWRTCVVGPDIQAGFLRTGDNTFEPTHDPAAIEVFLEILAKVKPSVVVLLGDNLDLPEFGKYRQHPAFQLTTQMTLDYMHTLCARIREICGDEAKIVWLAGNHDERLPNFIIDNAKAAFGIKRANTPESWPVLSIPHLLHLDELNIDFLSGYPSNHFWLTPTLRFIHGHSVKSKGSTAHLYLQDEKVSVIYGHIHRREWAEQTRVDYDGISTIMAASPGCLARLDGTVPSVKQGMDLDGRPVPSAENWQQGLAVVEYHDDGRFRYDQVAIHTEMVGGQAVKWSRYDGAEYRCSMEYTVRPNA